jgi:hypothetical protein
MCVCSVYSPFVDPTRPAMASRKRNPPGGAMTSSVRVPGLTREIRVKIATEPEEFKAAFELVASNYRARGYESESDKPYRFTPYHVLPGTVTLVASHEGKVVATLSLVPDTALLGLPLECIYGDEIARLRREGRRLAEATSLADTGLSLGEFVAVFKSLIKLAMQYHKAHGGDSWVIVVHPRHRSFYQRALGFVPLGSQRSYPSVQNHPGEAYLLDADLMTANAPRMHHEVFGDELPHSILGAHRWSASRVQYFGSRSSHLDQAALGDLLEAIDNFDGTPRWSNSLKESRTIGVQAG